MSHTDRIIDIIRDTAENDGHTFAKLLAELLLDPYEVMDACDGNLVTAKDAWWQAVDETAGMLETEDGCEVLADRLADYLTELSL